MKDAAALELKTPVKFLSKWALTFVFCALLACAYVHLKDNPLPKVVLIGGFFLGVIVFLRTGLFCWEGIAYCWAAYFPFSAEHPFNFGRIVPGLNLTNIFLVLSLLLWFKENRKRGEPILMKTPLNIPIFIFILWGFFSILM